MRRGFSWRPGESLEAAGFEFPAWSSSLISISAVLLLALSLSLITHQTLANELVVSIEGQVFDAETGQPVVNATVQIDGTLISTRTSPSGRFSISYLPPGERTLKVWHGSYPDTSIATVDIRQDFTSKVRVVLYPETPRVGSITVRESLDRPGIQQIARITRADIDSSHVGDLTGLLRQVPGVEVRETGSGGGGTQVSIRGSAVRHVLVLLNGHPLNNSSTGEATIDDLPLDAIESIEVYRNGAGAEFGPGAVGGVISIVARPLAKLVPSQATVRGGAGSFGQRSAAVSLQRSGEHVDFPLTFTYDFAQATGDYPYTTTVAPTGRVIADDRINNHSLRRSYYLSTGHDFSARTQLSLSGQWSEATRGTPSRADRQNHFATVDEDRRIVTAQLTHAPLEQFQLEAHAGFSRSQQLFVDTLTTPSIYRFYDRQTNDIFTVELSSRWQMTASQSLSTALSYQGERLAQEDLESPDTELGATRRHDLGLKLGWRTNLQLPELLWFQRLVIDGIIRRDFTETRKDSLSAGDIGGDLSQQHWAPRISAVVSRGSDWRVSLRASYGKSLALPSLNALFWKRDALAQGNPLLKPERSEDSEIGLELSGTLAHVQLEAGATYYHKTVSDLIVWQAGWGDVWKPYNLHSARFFGHEQYLTASVLEGKLSVQFGNTSTVAKNLKPGLNSYGKRITFVPEYERSLRISLDLDWLDASYGLRWVGRRYVLENNEKWYDPYRLEDLKVSLQREFGSFEGRLTTSVDNLQNTHYDLVPLHPMPPREWQVGLAVTYHLGTAHHSTSSPTTSGKD